MPTSLDERIAALRGLGLTYAADQLDTARQMQDKLERAYAHYRFLTREDITAFNAKLQRQASEASTFQRLRFTELDRYGKVPPDEVLVALAQAQDRGCFDYFEVADIESVTIVPDPLLLGRIRGSDVYFFITQWDDDVKISDILQADQGWIRPDGPR
jgi:hypothetical protein